MTLVRRCKTRRHTQCVHSTIHSNTTRRRMESSGYSHGETQLSCVVIVDEPSQRRPYHKSTVLNRSNCTQVASGSEALRMVWNAIALIKIYTPCFQVSQRTVAEQWLSRHKYSRRQYEQRSVKVLNAAAVAGAQTGMASLMTRQANWNNRRDQRPATEWRHRKISPQRQKKRGWKEMVLV